MAPPHRLGRGTPGCLRALTPAYHARFANSQQTRHLATAPSPFNQGNGTLTKIQ
jgi:hypothetical protein